MRSFPESLQQTFNPKKSAGKAPSKLFCFPEGVGKPVRELFAFPEGVGKFTSELFAFPKGVGNLSSKLFTFRYEFRRIHQEKGPSRFSPCSLTTLQLNRYLLCRHALVVEPVQRRYAEVSLLLAVVLLLFKDD